MKKVGRRLAALATAVGLALAGVLAGQGTAQAVWSCHYWRSGSSAYASCDYGLGGVRAWANCDWGDPTLYLGPWVTAGNVSSVVCRNGLIDHGYQTWSG